MQKKCDPKAHVTCGNWDTSVHDLCGYWLEAAPDHYVNEEWFGITSPTRCATSIDSLRPREVYWGMREIWTGVPDAKKDKSLFKGCDDLIMGTCVSLGDGGRGGDGAAVPALSWLGQVLGGPTHAANGKPLPCSGRGACTTKVQECGDGTFNASATPCCSCDMGFAGVGCSTVDTRVYIAFGVVALLGALLGGMIMTSVWAAISRARFRRDQDLSQPFLAR